MQSNKNLPNTFWIWRKSINDPPGRIKRVSNNSELGKCSSCQMLVPIHTHASRVIRDRGHEQFTSRPD